MIECTPKNKEAEMQGEAKYIYFNGEFVGWEDAKIHILSHVVQYGSGVFEGIRCYGTAKGPAIFRGLDHFKRFKNSMKIYRMNIEKTPEKLEEIAKTLIVKNGLKSAYVRPVAYRGYGEIAPNPEKLKTEVAIAAFDFGEFLAGNPDKGINVMVSSWRRPAPDTIPMLAKADGNYLNSQLASMEASQYGFKEAIMLDVNGFISEGPGENIFLVKDGILYTPPVGASLLKGITRDSIMKVAKSLGIEIKEEFMPREMLYIADEVFFAGTAAEVTPIGSVDKIPVGNGTIGTLTRKIRDTFFDIVQNGNDPYGWLDFVK
jgi:branched-chain amino acid aminotransferase